jgi:hypothetical protein
MSNETTEAAVVVPRNKAVNKATLLAAVFAGAAAGQTHAEVATALFGDAENSAQHLSSRLTVLRTEDMVRQLAAENLTTKQIANAEAKGKKEGLPGSVVNALKAALKAKKISTKPSEVDAKFKRIPKLKNPGRSGSSTVDVVSDLISQLSDKG